MLNLKKIVGFIVVIISSLIYALEPSVFNLVLVTGLHPSRASLLRVLLVFSITFGICLAKKLSLKISFKTAAGLFLMGCIGMGITSILLASAYQYMPVGAATVIHFVYPSLVCIAVTVIDRKKLTVLAVLAMICSIASIFMISGGSITGSFIGILLALLSGITYAYYVIRADRTNTGDYDLNVRMLYIWLGSMVPQICYRVFSDSSGGQWTPATVGIICGCAVLSVIASYCFVIGVGRIGAALAAFFSLMEPMGSVIFSTLIFRYDMSALTVIGCAVAILAVLLISINSYREETAMLREPAK